MDYESAKLKALMKKPPRNAREQGVLFGLIELHIKTGKPIGSQTLQENGFESLSSATIRNYLAKLEETGYLIQPHTSGGRLPTAKAYQAYAEHFQGSGTLEKAHGDSLEEAFQEGRGITALIHRSAEALSRLSKCAVFISTPRFDQDFVQDVRLLFLDPTRLLAVIITDFGVIRTEVIFTEQEIDETFLKECERYFLWRLNKGENVTFQEESLLKMAQRLYNEIMVRHVVSYLNFSREDIFRCGTSRLLAYPEFSDASSVVNSLALLENENEMRALLGECSKNRSLTFWIGEEELCPENAAIAIPYCINQAVVGSVALLGPLRLPYPELFGLMRHFSELLTKSLTEMVYKFKITFREPSCSTLLEHKTRKQ
jgi:heat-inducible transcriptional repressor